LHILAKAKERRRGERSDGAQVIALDSDEHERSEGLEEGELEGAEAPAEPEAAAVVASIGKKKKKKKEKKDKRMKEVCTLIVALKRLVCAVYVLKTLFLMIEDDFITLRAGVLLHLMYLGPSSQFGSGCNHAEVTGYINFR